MSNTKAFNLYPGDGIIVPFSNVSSYFGLISRSESNCDELHGYEITLSGRLVLPELTPQPEQEEQNQVQAILC